MSFPHDIRSIDITHKTNRRPSDATDAQEAPLKRSFAALPLREADDEPVSRPSPSDAERGDNQNEEKSRRLREMLAAKVGSEEAKHSQHTINTRLIRSTRFSARGTPRSLSALSRRSAILTRAPSALSPLSPLTPLPQSPCSPPPSSLAPRGTTRRPPAATPAGARHSRWRAPSTAQV